MFHIPGSATVVAVVAVPENLPIDMDWQLTYDRDLLNIKL